MKCWLRLKIIVSLFLLFIPVPMPFGPANALGQMWWRFESPGEWVRTAISADGNYVVASSDKLYLFHKSGSIPLWEYPITGSLAISQDGAFIVVGSPGDHHVYLFGRDSAEHVALLWRFDTGSDVTDVAISADGANVVAGTDVRQGGEPTVYLFHKDQGTPVWTYAAGMQVKALDISKDGETIAAAVDGWPISPGRVYLFSAQSMEPLWWADVDTPTSVALSADGGHLATGDWRHHVRLFSRQSSTPLWDHDTGGYVYEVDISDDGEHIAAATGGADGGVILYGRTGSEPIWKFDTNYSMHVAISASGQYIAAAGGDYVHRVYLFSRDNPFPILNYDTHNWLNAVSISDSGQEVATADLDNGYVYFFDTGPIIRGDVTRYRYTKIADTKGQFKIVWPNAAIGCDGTVVFYASKEDGAAGIYVGDGGKLTPVAETGGQFAGFGSSPSINCEGTVVFEAEYTSGKSGIFRAKNGTIIPVATTDRYFNLFSGNPKINDNDTVTFEGSLGVGPPSTGGIFKASQGVISAANLGMPVWDWNMNNADIIVFGATLAPFGNGIFAIEDGVITPLADTSGEIEGFGSPPSINTQGTVVVHAFLDDGETGIFEIQDGRLHQIVDNKHLLFERPIGRGLQINDQNRIVFRTNWGEAIVAGSNPLKDQVIARYDRLSDSTVKRLLLGGINAAGQIAFHAELNDGSQGIFRADPVPQANSIPMGDLTQDGEVDLRDTIVALQVITQNTGVALANEWGDVNGDNRLGLQEAIFPLLVTAGFRNRPPEMLAIEDQVGDEGARISFSVAATDADGDALVFSAANLPDGARFNPATRTFTWTPSHSQSGVYEAAFQAADPYIGSDPKKVKITVSDRIPVLTKDYFPMSQGNWWQNRDTDTGATESTWISGTRLLHGESASVFEDDADDRYYYSFNTDGLKLHGLYWSDPEFTSEFIFDTPLLIQPNQATIGTKQRSNATFTITSDGTTFHVDVTTDSEVVGLKDVQTENSVLKDCFKISFRIRGHIRGPEDTESIDSGIGYDWFCKGVGSAKSAMDGSETMIELSVVDNRITLH